MRKSWLFIRNEIEPAHPGDRMGKDVLIHAPRKNIRFFPGREQAVVLFANLPACRLKFLRKVWLFPATPTIAPAGATEMIPASEALMPNAAQENSVPDI